MRVLLAVIHADWAANFWRGMNGAMHFAYCVLRAGAATASRMRPEQHPGLAACNGKRLLSAGACESRRGRSRR